MSMSKKDFIRLAEYVKDSKKFFDAPFSEAQINILANFCAEQNSNFMRERWLDFIAGTCGPNGGKVKV